MLVLAYLRKGETFADLAAGFGVGHRDRLALCHGERGPWSDPTRERTQTGALCDRALAVARYGPSQLAAVPGTAMLPADQDKQPAPARLAPAVPQPTMGGTGQLCVAFVLWSQCQS